MPIHTRCRSGGCQKPEGCAWALGCKLLREQPEPEPVKPTGHEWDDDAVCIHCGFDGAEWSHLKRYTHPDDANPEAKQPLCKRA